MSLGVFIIVLMAAVMHATWNSLIKGGKNPLLDSMLLSVVALFICLAIIPFVPLPHYDSWPYAAISAFVHIGYFLFLAKSYETGDLSVVYPIIRGLPPLIVMCVSLLFLSDQLSLYGILGVVLVGCGIVILSKNPENFSPKILCFALLTVLMIVSYTLVDGIGARLSGHSVSYLVWFSLVEAILYIALIFWMRGKEPCMIHIKQYWRRGVLSSSLAMLGYGLVLWAMTQAPIAYVSALRETSVLWALLIATLFLKEPFQKSRLVSVVFIFLGIATISLA